jgi:hypothetical protein
MAIVAAASIHFVTEFIIASPSFAGFCAEYWQAGRQTVFET